MYSSCASRRFGFLFSLTVAILGPSAVLAEPIHTFGAATIVASPPSDLSVVVDTPIVFFEHEETGEYSLPVNLVAPGFASAETAPATCTDSVTTNWPSTDFVFVRPDPATLPRIDTGVIVFFGRVLGLAYERECMFASDAPFSHPGVFYPTAGGLDLGVGSQDAVEIFTSGRTVWHRMQSISADWDGYRVVVEAPAPDAMADIQMACPDSIGPFEAGDSTEITYDITNAGPAGAPDIQIAFRIPTGVRVDRYQGFDCREEVDADVHICTYPAGDLRSGESDELRVTLAFDARTSDGEVAAFGSGAVRDRPLENNKCFTSIAPWPAEDGGPITDGAVQDSATSDSATRDSATSDSTMGEDTGARDGAAAGPNFRGAGGCACEVAGADDPPTLPLFSGLLLACAFAWSRRGR